MRIKRKYAREKGDYRGEKGKSTQSEGGQILRFVYTDQLIARLRPDEHVLMIC